MLEVLFHAPSQDYHPQCRKLIYLESSHGNFRQGIRFPPNNQIIHYSSTPNTSNHSSLLPIMIHQYPPLFAYLSPTYRFPLKHKAWYDLPIIISQSLLPLLTTSFHSHNFSTQPTTIQYCVPLRTIAYLCSVPSPPPNVARHCSPMA